MGMTPDQYFQGFVEQNRWDCQHSPGDIRLAFNAAVSASHLADHYFSYNKRHNPEIVKPFHNIGEFVSFLSKNTNGCFRDIRSISNAYKHLYTNIDAPHSSYSSVDSSGSISAINLDDEFIEGLEEEFFENSENDTERLQVVFKRRDGSKAIFLPVLDTVVDYFGKLIY